METCYAAYSSLANQSTCILKHLANLKRRPIIVLLKKNCLWFFVISPPATDDDNCNPSCPESKAGRQPSPYWATGCRLL